MLLFWLSIIGRNERKAKNLKSEPRIYKIWLAFPSPLQKFVSIASSPQPLVCTLTLHYNVVVVSEAQSLLESVEVVEELIVAVQNSVLW